MNSSFLFAIFFTKSKKVIRTILLCIIIFTSFYISAANRYWVSGSNSNWNNTANWSTKFRGSGGASVPARPIWPFLMPLGTGNCNIDVNVNVAGIQIAGYTGTITQT